MKQFNLEEYLKNPSKKVITRVGKPVKIHCTNFNHDQSVIAEIEGSNCSASYFPNGRLSKDRDNSCDLFFVTEKHEGWINLYKNVNGYIYPSQIWKTKEDAEKSENYIATVKIEWEE